MTPEEVAEQHLIKRLLKKESSAWKEVYDKYSGNFTSIGCRYINGGDDLRDVLQNSFVKMFTHIQTFDHRGKGALRAWMSRIVVNECLQFLRKDGKMLFQEDIEWEQISQEETEPEVDSLSSEEIIQHVQSLPDGYRTVFNLYVFEEKSHVEIAEILGITEGTSASQFSRAKKLLATKIKNYQLSKTSVL